MGSGLCPFQGDWLVNNLRLVRHGTAPTWRGAGPSAEKSVKSGKLRAIGVSSPTRAALLPDVPAIAEALPGFSGDLWVAFYAPAGTPPAIVERLYRSVESALASPAVQERFQQLGVTALHDGPAQLARRQEAEFEQWRKIVRASGATAN